MKFEQYFFVFNKNKKLNLTDLLINHLKTLKLIIAFRFENDRTILSNTDYYSTLEELQNFYKENKDFLEIIDTGNNKISFETIVSEITDWQEREKLEYQNRRNGILPKKYQDLTLEKIKIMQEEFNKNYGFINSVSDFSKLGNDIRREFSNSSLSVPFELEENGEIVVMDKYFIQITFEDFIKKYNILKTDKVEEILNKMNIKYILHNFEKEFCTFENKGEYTEYKIHLRPIKKNATEDDVRLFESRLLEHLGWSVIFLENCNQKYISIAKDNVFNYWDKNSVVDEFYNLLLKYLDKYN